MPKLKLFKDFIHTKLSPYLFLLGSFSFVLVKSLLPLIELFERPVSRVVHYQLKRLLPARCGGHTLNNGKVNLIQTQCFKCSGFIIKLLLRFKMMIKFIHNLHSLNIFYTLSMTLCIAISTLTDPGHFR